MTQIAIYRKNVISSLVVRHKHIARISIYILATTHIYFHKRQH